MSCHGNDIMIKFLLLTPKSSRYLKFTWGKKEKRAPRINGGNEREYPVHYKY